MTYKTEGVMYAISPPCLLSRSSLSSLPLPLPFPPSLPFL